MPMFLWSSASPGEGREATGKRREPAHALSAPPWPTVRGEVEKPAYGPALGDPESRAAPGTVIWDATTN